MTFLTIVLSLRHLSDASKSVYTMEIVWINVILLGYMHFATLYGLYLVLTENIRMCELFHFITGFMGSVSITAGAHRLWAHKAYKVTMPLKIILTVLQTFALQNSIVEWSRDHRVHHKYTETDADPHDATRGFFFAHMGWLLVKKHPAVKEKGKTVDMSDLVNDPLIALQHKYYAILDPMISFVIPVIISSYIFDCSISHTYHMVMARYIISLHLTWFVNSAAHLYGSHPYDGTINPAENRFVGSFALGEGWHNYHHTFPWDYRASELSPSKSNFTAPAIDRMAKIGWAYDLKTVPHNVMMQRIARTGDGSYVPPSGKESKNHIHSGPWGWGDKDIPQQSIIATQILYPKIET